MTRFFVIAICFALLGCGYHLLGGDGKAAVALGEVNDLSREPLFGAYMREALADYTFTRSDTTHNTGRRLNVKLKEILENFGAFDSKALPWEYQLTAIADAEVLGPDGKVEWTGKGVTSRQVYSVANSINETVVNKNLALKLLADKLAKEILRYHLASQYK